MVERLQELCSHPCVWSRRRLIKDYRLNSDSAPALETAGALADPALRAALWQYFAGQPPVWRPPCGRWGAPPPGGGAALSRRAVQALYGSRISMSASRLERLSFMPLCLLHGIRPARQSPGRAAAFDAPQIGTFLHFLLENVTREVLERGGFAQVDDAALRALAASLD